MPKDLGEKELPSIVNVERSINALAIHEIGGGDYAINVTAETIERKPDGSVFTRTPYPNPSGGNNNVPIHFKFSDLMAHEYAPGKTFGALFVEIQTAVHKAIDMMEDKTGPYAPTDPASP